MSLVGKIAYMVTEVSDGKTVSVSENNTFSL